MLEGRAAAHTALLLPLRRALHLPPLGPPVLEPHLDHRETDRTGEGRECVKGKGTPTKKGRQRDTEGGTKGSAEKERKNVKIGDN